MHFMHACGGEIPHGGISTALPFGSTWMKRLCFEKILFRSSLLSLLSWLSIRGFGRFENFVRREQWVYSTRHGFAVKFYDTNELNKKQSYQSKKRSHFFSHFSTFYLNRNDETFILNSLHRKRWVFHLLFWMLYLFQNIVGFVVITF